MVQRSKGQQVDVDGQEIAGRSRADTSVASESLGAVMKNSLYLLGIG